MSNYSALLIAQGATHYWSLDEASVPYSDAISGVQLDHSETVTSTLGAINKGVLFQGSGNVRSLTQDNTIAFSSSAGFSYSYLALFVDYSSNRGVLCKRQTSSTGRTFSSFVFNTAATTGLSFDIGNNQRRWSTNYYPPVKEWVHITYTYDPTTVTGRAYVNGNLLESTNYGTAPNSTQTSAHFMIGALQSDTAGNAGSFMNGIVDEVAIFANKTLTPEEVLAQATTVLPVMRIYDGTNWIHADKKVIGS